MLHAMQAYAKTGLGPSPRAVHLASGRWKQCGTRLCSWLAPLQSSGYRALVWIKVAKLGTMRPLQTRCMVAVMASKEIVRHEQKASSEESEGITHISSCEEALLQQ
jgi:hypothetical protein